jgi:hypothetical protein
MAKPPPSVTSAPSATSALDRPSARVAAGLIVLLVLAALAWMHREDLFPSQEAAPAAADDPAARCFAERGAEVDRMRDEGTINDQQAALFKSRAEAFCQAQFGGGSGPPAIPAQ